MMKQRLYVIFAIIAEYWKSSPLVISGVQQKVMEYLHNIAFYAKLINNK